MKKQGNLSIALRLLGLVKPLTGFMALAVMLGTLGHLSAAFLTIAGGYALLALLGMSVPLTLTGLLICVAVFALVRGSLRYGEQTCNHYIAFKLLASIRDQVFGALRRLSPAKLATADKGNLLSVITTDVELLEVFFAHTVSPVFIAVLVSAAMSVFIGSFHPLLGVLAALSYAIVGIVIPVAVLRRGGSAGTRFRQKAGGLSAFVLDSLRGLAEIIQYGRGEERLVQMQERTDALAKDEEGIKRQAGTAAAVSGAVILVLDLCMLLVSALLFQAGQIPFSGVLIPVIALMSSFGPVIALADLGGLLQNTLAAGGRVLDLLDETPAVDDISGRPLVAFQGAEAKNVRFSYGGAEVLSDICLSVPEHAVVGITGASGSGKSTVLKLLMRFWDAGSGHIRISGTDIDSINTGNLREMESLVTQETQLFKDSIRNNIRIAKPDATDEEITEACRKASLHAFIQSLPQGYDTPVGELGDTLSGGERQRIGLARAFLHAAPLMLLDEPTSNLDSLNEATVLRSLQQARGDTTVVIVSHRQSTMRIADKVYSVDGGRAS